MRRVVFAVYAMTVLALYGVASWWGWGFSSGKRGYVPAGVHQAPGGYRSFSFWRGGK